jgi:hypothetical protein
MARQETVLEDRTIRYSCLDKACEQINVGATMSVSWCTIGVWELFWSGVWRLLCGFYGVEMLC